MTANADAIAMPVLAKLFMVGVGLVSLGCVFAMLPFLTGRTHGFSAVLALPSVVLLGLCAIVIHWGVTANPIFLIAAKLLLVLCIILPLVFAGANAPAMFVVIVSAPYLVYFFRSKRLRVWYRKP